MVEILTLVMYLVANTSFVLALWAKENEDFKTLAFCAIFMILSAIYWGLKRRKED